MKSPAITAELVSIALTQLNAEPETAKLAERYVSQSHAGCGVHQITLKTLQEAISPLQRALRIAGVVVPQTAEN